MRYSEFAKWVTIFYTMCKPSVALATLQLSIKGEVVSVNSCMHPAEIIPNIHKHTFQKENYRDKLAI